jgi:hypothetical protein
MNTLSSRAAAIRDALPPIIFRSDEAELELKRLFDSFHEPAALRLLWSQSGQRADPSRPVCRVEWR